MLALVDSADNLFIRAPSPSFPPFICVARVSLIFCAWCWLNTVLLCLSWCVGTVRKRRGGNRSGVQREAEDGNEDGKAVHATVCGTLACVVCVSYDTSTGKSTPSFFERPF